jgi:acetyltransferase-like isoleucine patch superfamily enzyme
MLHVPFQLLIYPLPWCLRRRLLATVYRFSLHPTAAIGFSLIRCRKLIMAEGSRIGHFNVLKGVEAVKMEEKASIGNLNWITGFPLDDKSFFGTEYSRLPTLTVERHAAITNRHFIDCTNEVVLGSFSIIGGWYSQILTHSIDFRTSRQCSAPVRIGAYCFVGTGVIILKGGALPDNCVLAAGSVLNAPVADTYTLYAGVPAKSVKKLDRELRYFVREAGIVN